MAKKGLGIRGRERARTPEAKEELRARILQEAVSLFVEEGYTGFSMRKLAKRLHYSAPTLYAYFTSKDELLLAIIGEGYSLFRSYVTVPGNTPMELFHALGSAYMDFAFRNPTLYTLMFIRRPGALFDLSEETVKERLGILHAVVSTARKAPLFSRMDDAAVQQTVELFWAVAHGLVSIALTIPLFDEQWARRNLRFLMRTLEPLLTSPGDSRALPLAQAAR
jgi:AcrR family transcriptional regulator